MVIAGVAAQQGEGVVDADVAVLGDDAFGHDILAHTRGVGVDVSGVKALAGQRTATYLSMHGPDGDMALAVNDMAILESLTPALLTSEAAMPARAQDQQVFRFLVVGEVTA